MLVNFKTVILQNSQISLHHINRHGVNTHSINKPSHSFQILQIFFSVAYALVLIFGLGQNSSARAETLNSALSKAYETNPDINQQRAATRAQDENLPKAKGGYLPTVNATANAGYNDFFYKPTPSSGFNFNTVANKYPGQSTAPRGVGLGITENIYNGGKTAASVSQADAQILGQRETLRNTVQNTLLNGVTYYMNVLRDTAILDLQNNNVDVLREQLRQTNERFNVGEVTRTDVAQAQASLAGAQATALTAQSNLQTSIANYRQVIGVDPKSLNPAQPLVRPLPKNLGEAISISQVEHPSILAAQYGVDSASLNVKIVQSALYPTLGVSANVQRLWDAQYITGQQNIVGLISASLTVPIYEGGVTYASTRQAKEQLGQQQLNADLQRTIVRAAVVSAWGVFDNSDAVLKADQSQVKASEIALSGVREEAKVGQRTTLDVLNAEQALLNARVQLVSAQRDRVVASYALLSAIGRLSPQIIGLSTAPYNPTAHYNAVKDKWIGLRTPDEEKEK